VVGAFFALSAGSALAGQCGVCQVIPATATTITTSSSSTTTHVKVVVHKTVTQNVQEFETVTHKVVVFNQNINHSSTAGLTSCHWGVADWSGWNTVNGQRRFTKNAPHGRTHMCWDAHLHVWLQVGQCGKQLCCGNIVVPPEQPPPPKRERVVAIVHFSSHKQFMSTFNKWVTKSNSSNSTTTTSTVYSCPVGWTLEGTSCKKCPPPCPPPPPPINHPPTGSLQPPLHIFVNDTQPVCVDNVSDPDGDPVSLTFTFLDTNGNVVGTKVGSVWQQPGGAWCQYFKAPSTPQQVSVFVKLDDGHGGTPTLSDNIPVVPDQFSKS
jgi:hypothetical protein